MSLRCQPKPIVWWVLTTVRESVDVSEETKWLLDRQRYPRSTHRHVPGATPPFPAHHLHGRAPNSFPFDPNPTYGAIQTRTTDRLCAKPMALAGRSSVCYNQRTEAGGGLVPIVLFLIFVAVVGVLTLALGYVLSTVEESTASRRCGMPQGTRLKRKARRQRVRCRFKG